MLELVVKLNEKVDEGFDVIHSLIVVDGCLHRLIVVHDSNGCLENDSA
jgi:hypothetical protein